MSEPEITWSDTFNHDDVSRWYEPKLVVEQCCQSGWLPLIDGTMIQCPYHADET